MMKTAAFAAAAVAVARAQVYTGSSTTYTVTQDTGADIPLASKHFTYPDLPYKADSGSTERGIQVGYNICNSTTLGEKSMCQTAHVNDIRDFCIWGSSEPNELVANVEAGMVAYCTTDKWGTRVLQPGTLQGVQFITTPDYIEVVGFLDQTKINLQADDTGGEEDPHGADFRGNPLGGLVFSTAFKNSEGAPATQVIEWDYFVGSGVFCFKACDPAGENAASLCEHRYDEIGCAYNSPASYDKINGTFSDCKGDNQTPVGQYVSNGVTVTWTQPYNEEFTVPYTAAIPATSQCSTFSSNQLYSAASSAASSGASSTSGKRTATSGADEPSGSSDSGSSSDGSSSGAVAHGLAGLTLVAGVVVGALAVFA